MVRATGTAVMVRVHHNGALEREEDRGRNSEEAAGRRQAREPVIISVSFTIPFAQDALYSRGRLKNVKTEYAPLHG
jgi:hypothetical protein